MSFYFIILNPSNLKIKNSSLRVKITSVQRNTRKLKGFGSSENSKKNIVLQGAVLRPL